MANVLCVLVNKYSCVLVIHARFTIRFLNIIPLMNIAVSLNYLIEIRFRIIILCEQLLSV